MAGKFVQGNWLLPNNVNANKQSNYSFDFDGFSYIDFGDNVPPFNNTTSKFSISFWLNRESTTTNKCIFENRGTTYNSGISFEVRPGTSEFWFFIYPSAGGYAVTKFATSSVPINQWNHIAIVFDGTQTGDTNRLKIYVNNSSLTLNYHNPVPANVLGSGTGDTFRLAEGVQPNFQGKIDEFCIFTRPLSSGDVNSLYNSGTPGNPFDLSGDPVAYYKLGETAIGQAPGGTWNWQIPNHAQTQLAWGGDTTAALSPHASIGLPVGGENLGTVHTLSYWINNNNVSLNNSKAGQWFCKEFGNNILSSGHAVADRGIIFGNNFSTINNQMPVNGVYITYRTGGSTSTTNMQFPLGSIDLLDNQTYNIIFVRNGSSVKCFINGQEITNPVGSIDSTYELIFDTINFNDYATNKTEWRGIMSNVAVWKSDRESEVPNIYNNGEPQPNYTTAPDLWYKLDDTTTSHPAQYKRAINQSLSSESYVKSYLKQPFTSGGAPSQYNAVVSILDTDLNLGTSYSFSFWMALDPSKTEFDGYYNKMCYYLGTTGSNGTSFGAADGGILFQNGDGYGSSNVGINWTVYDTNGNSTGNIVFNNSSTPSYTNASDGSFHNYMFVKDGQTVSFYFDNQLVDSGTMSGELSNTILNNINGGNNLLGGHARQLRWAEWSFFANKVLSSSERATIYNSGNPGDISSVSPSLWYSYDNIDVANNKLIDKSSSNNDASTVRIRVTTQNTDAFQGRYIKYMDGVQSVYDNNLSSTDLGLHNPLYSQFSNFFNNTASDRISIPYVLPAGTTKFSVSIWGNISALTTSVNKCLIAQQPTGGTTSEGFSIFTSNAYPNTNVWFKVENNTGTQTTSNIVFGEWFHILATYDSGTAKIYFNGVLEDTTTGITSPLTTINTTQTILGSLNPSGTTIPMEGNLDDCAIWSGTTLTGQQAAQIYNNGKPSDISYLSPTNWWKLGDSSYTNSSNYYVFPNEIANAPDGISHTAYKPSISSNAPKAVAPGVSSGLAELDKKGDAPNSTSNSISYNILKTDQSIYTPKYVSQYTVDNNYSMSFDGVNDYFSLNSINLGTTNTISFWYNGEAITYSTVLGSDDAPNDYTIWVDSNGTHIAYKVQAPSSAPVVNWNITSINDGNWHHLAFSRINTTINLYIDGNLQTVNSNSLVNNDTKIDTIGAKTDGSYPFKGELDEVAFFNKALTADQIKFEIYEASATANKSADFINNPNLPDPVAWYRMGD